MKKTLLILALAVMGTGAASANTNIATYFQQGQGPQGTPEERATAMTGRMNEVLTLTAEQKPKIQAINLKRIQEQAAIREKAAGDREAMMTQMRALNEKYSAEFKTVLTAEQYTKYEANMAQFRGGRGGQGGQGGQGGGQTNNQR